MLAARRILPAGCAWVPVFVLPAIPWVLVPPDAPRWVFMWAMAFSLYAGVKWLSWCGGDAVQAAGWKHLAYLLAWPGMDKRAFLRPKPLPKQPTAREWCAAVVKCVLGAALMFGAAAFTGRVADVIVGWCEMIGLVLTLHCGVFHLLSCLWRTLGLDAKPIMNSPLLATSVSEFWGRRWNLAFRDLTHRFVFRPLTARYGAVAALWVGFLISGFIHELAITVPTGSGYGGPTVFFLLQAVALFVERSTWGRRVGLGRGTIGWAFSASVLILPVGLLLPPAFVCEIIVPFCRDLVAFGETAC
jgi:Membrane bound O-acyl transferase family